jgi:spore maturation protein CgeB
MRILISGYHNPRYLTFTEYIERAVRTIGHELIIFNDRDHIFPGRLRRRLEILQKISLGSINRSLIKLVRRTRPDVVIITGGHRITPKALKQLGREDLCTVLWTTDAPVNFQPIINSAPFYSFVFCLGTEAIDLLRDAGIDGSHWLPMACDVAHHRSLKLSKEEQNKYCHDVVFVGSYYPNRAELFEKLTDFNFGVWGPGWDKLDKNFRLRDNIRAAHTKPSEWVKIYDNSKIVLATHYQDPEYKFPVHQASARIFEAMANGGFVLSDNQRDVFLLFKDGEHLVSYNGHEDLIFKIKYYLSHDAERRKIAERGQQEVLRNHQYIHRIEKLISIVDAG